MSRVTSNRLRTGVGSFGSDMCWCGGLRETASCIWRADKQTEHHIILRCETLRPLNVLDDLASPSPPAGPVASVIEKRKLLHHWLVSQNFKNYEETNTYKDVRVSQNLSVPWVFLKRKTNLCSLKDVPINISYFSDSLRYWQKFFHTEVPILRLRFVGNSHWGFMLILMLLCRDSPNICSCSNHITETGLQLFINIS